MTRYPPPMSGGILIVDDSDVHLMAVSGILGELNRPIVTARSGREALEILTTQKFAVILLDVQMPEMDGFEVAQQIRRLHEEVTPILFVTGSLDSDEKLFRVYESGAVDVLQKPVNAFVLQSKVRVFLRLYDSHQLLAEEVEAHKRTLADLDAFNYSVSHDLRAPLRPISGFSQILLEDYEGVLDGEGRNLLERIVQATRRMDELIEGLLRLSRVGRARPSTRELDLHGLATAILDELTQQDGARHVSATVEPNLIARGDEQLVRIALENLLRNAWKFTSKTEHARIEVGSLQRAPEDVEHTFFVRDNGVGFDPTRADKLFTPFQRLHRPADFEGTGIGLAIVKRVIHHHRGRVWAEAQPNAGATFFFTLPA